MKTDLQLQQDVMAELKWEPAVHAAQIGVEWQYQREDAANSVRYLAGVTGLSNQVAIKPSVSGAGVRNVVDRMSLVV